MWTLGLALLMTQVFTVSRAYIHVVVGSKTIFMSTSSKSYGNVDTICSGDNLEEYFVRNNAEFSTLQAAISGNTYRNTIFWLKVRQVDSGGIRYYWQDEEVQGSAWFTGTDDGDLEPNGRGDGCQNDPICCTRLSTRWGVGYSNEQGTVSGLHELTDIACDINARFFCATPEVTTTEEPTTQPTTTEEPTTQPTTTEEPTTQPATTEEPTTQPATTEEPTTQPATTEEPTTQPATTEEPTTQQVTTEELTTQSATTEELTTQQATTEELITQTATTEEPTTQPATTEELTTQSVTTEEPTTQPISTDAPTSQASSSYTHILTTLTQSSTSTPSRCQNASNSGSGDLWDCACSPLVPNATIADIVPVIEETKKYLSVHIPSLSATIRRLTSADDRRPSSIAMGTVAIVFMIFTYGSIIAIDVINMVVSYKVSRHGSER